jgi:hypothetical protein
MPSKSAIQYTIRGIPQEIDAALRAKAHARNISLNQLVVEELTSATGTSTMRTYRSLKGIAGKWKEDPQFDKALEDQRQIDWNLWR